MGYQAVVEWQGNTFVYNPSPAPANLMLDNTRPAPEFIPATEAEWLGGGSSGNTTTKVMTG